MSDDLRLEFADVENAFGKCGANPESWELLRNQEIQLLDGPARWRLDQSSHIDRMSRPITYPH